MISLFVLAVCAFLVAAGCESQQEIQRLESAIQDRQVSIDGLQQQLTDVREGVGGELERIDASLAEALTEEERAEVTAVREAIVGRLTEWETSINGRIDSFQEEQGTFSTKIENILNAPTPQEGVGHTINTIGGLLPPPFGSIAYLVGGGLLAGAQQRRRGEQKTKAVVKSIRAGKNGDGSVDWKKVGEFQAAMGVRDTVRNIIEG
jgi:outer membrane murein-binding lipoprotein Lpp